MSNTRITRPRRIFVEAITGVQSITFSDLKKQLVGKGEDKIDITTLYRMIEIFKQQGLIHEVEHKNEKIIFLAGDFDPNKQSVEIIVCNNCGSVSARYTPLPLDVASQVVYTNVKKCDFCE